jgi:curli biogenesis system outer membrane secretion channel CsgG
MFRFVHTKAHKALWILLICLCGIISTSAATKVAIVSPRWTPPEAGDLLTVELSKLAGVQVLERAELDRIAREHSLSPTSAADSLKAGRILGADAVVFLEAAGSTNISVTWRVATVKQGAVLNAKRTAWIPAEAARWANRVATDLAPLLAKVATPAERQVKVSVLNLRSPGSTAASEELDRELTRLLLLRLAQERDLFVLERRKLADLAFEKDLSAASEQFWTGSHLLDGAVNREGISGDKVTLDLRLRAPNGETSEIKNAGTRQDLPGLIEKTVAAILEKLHVTASPGWDRAREASQHALEAEWALRWKMYDEAQAAADSAWLLGLQTPECAAMRTAGYARPAANPDRTWRYLSNERGFVSVEPLAAPDAARIKPLRAALAVTEMVLANHTSWMTNETWNRAVCETLSTSGDILEEFYWCPNVRPPEALEEVREISRSIWQRAIEVPEVRAMHWINATNPPLLQDLDRYYEEPNIFRVVATYGSVFDEAPEMTLHTYEILFSGDAVGYVREYLVDHFREHPLMGGGRVAQPRSKKLWVDLITNFAKSTNVVTANEGKFFSMTFANDLDEIAKTVSELEKQFLPGKPLLRAYKARPRFQPALGRLGEKFEGGADWAFRGERIFGSDRLDYPDTNVGQALMLAQFERLKPRLFAQWQNLEPFDAKLIELTIPGVQDPAFAKEVLPLAEEYFAKGTNKPGVFREHDATLMADQIRFLKAVANREENRLQMEARLQEMRTRPRQISTKPTPNRVTNLATVLPIPMGPNEYSRIAPDKIGPNAATSEPVYEAGYLWFVINREVDDDPRNPSAPGSHYEGSIAQVDPATALTALTRIPVKSLSYGPEPVFARFNSKGGRRIFGVTSNYVFVAQGAELLGLDWRSKQWKRFPLPSATGDIYVVNEKPFLSAEEAIYEITGDGSSTVVLASARRKPALTTLDALPTLGRPQLFPGGRKVRAVIKGNVHEFDGTDWKQITHFPEGTKAWIRGGTAILDVPQNLWTGEEVHLLTPDRSEPFFLGANLPQRREDQEKGIARMKEARFALPDFYVPGAHLIVGGHFAVFGTRVGAEGDGIRAAFSITIYDPTVSQPFSISIDSDGMLPNRHGNFFFTDDRVWFAETAEGLCVGVPESAGFWKIPKPTFEKAVAQAKAALIRAGASAKAE